MSVSVRVVEAPRPRGPYTYSSSPRALYNNAKLKRDPPCGDHEQANAAWDALLLDLGRVAGTGWMRKAEDRVLWRYVRPSNHARMYISGGISGGGKTFTLRPRCHGDHRHARRSKTYNLTSTRGPNRCPGEEQRGLTSVTN
ncbi:unnamed protein product [Plutella xylostella]|uniref:(diamondback moth) hypothetical protein n=1 Tax=Plutella xylostella TaxID=51655 RepID=A0A8S4FEZ2_PLUXY|nr:unnamed protein product [Plutella xylostella]